MRNTSTALALLLLAGTASAAQAATVISENETGVISGPSTTDTLGLFGPAGANLTGKTITIHTQYVPAYFGSVTNCRIASSCTKAISQGSLNTPGAVLISLTVNGKQVVYTSAHIGQVLFDKGSQNFFNIYADTLDFGYGYNGVRVSTSFSSPVTFGSTLSPTNPPALNTPVDNVEFFQIDDELPAETLFFAVTSATK